MKLYLKRKGVEKLERIMQTPNVSTIRIVSEDGLMVKPFHFTINENISLKRSLMGVYLLFPREGHNSIILQLEPKKVKPVSPPKVYVYSYRIEVVVGIPLDDPAYRQGLEREMKIRLLREINEKMRAQGHTFEITAQMIETEFEESVYEESAGGVRFTMTSKAFTYYVSPSRFEAALESRYR